jgi:cytochrome c oxidase subunit 4
VSDITLRDDSADEAAIAAAGGTVEPAPGLLPGELRPHPSPLQYVVIAVVLCAITAAEVSLYYLQGDIPNAAIIPLLLIFAALKFGIVASWYMHLRTDRPIFARFFVLGIAAAVLLFLVVLTSLQIFS